jgi:hypothetical protein
MKLGALTAGMLSLLIAGTALGAGQTTPPHIKGSTYCETVTKPDDYTLYGYVKGVSCATEKSFVARCEVKRGLQGWSYSSSNEYGFILRKGGGTLDLQIAGGSPPCILAAQM